MADTIPQTLPQTPADVALVPAAAGAGAGTTRCPAQRADLAERAGARALAGKVVFRIPTRRQTRRLRRRRDAGRAGHDFGSGTREPSL